VAVALDSSPSVSADFRLLAKSFRRILLAENKSPNTVEVYGSALERLGEYLAAQGMPTEPEHIARVHVESFVGHLLEHRKPATAANRY
jgi:site-specific recombinase XerD